MSDIDTVPEDSLKAFDFDRPIREEKRPNIRAAAKRRFVPEPDSCTAAKTHRYSTTSLAVICMISGTVRPSALAVLRLITSSNLVGC